MSRLPSTPCTACPNPGVRSKMRKDGTGYKHWPSCPGVPPTEPGDAAPTLATSTITPPGDVTIHEMHPPRRNRKGAVAVTRARECRFCHCTGEKPCDTNTGSCVWMDAKTPTAGDLCSVCAELVDVAREAFQDGTTDGEALALEVYEGAEFPCLKTFDEAQPRIGSIVAFVIAEQRRLKSGADDAAPDPRQIDWISTEPRPKDHKRDLRPATGTPVRFTSGRLEGRTGWVVRHAKGEDLTQLDVELHPLPGETRRVEGVSARDLTASDVDGNAVRGTCACGVVLTRVNSSRLPTGAMLHIGCPGTPKQELAILRVPCPPPLLEGTGGCGAPIGEACKFLLAKPASWAHVQRRELLPAAERAEAEQRAREDAALALMDYHASLPRQSPHPTEEDVVKGLQELDATISEEAVVEMLSGLFRAGKAITVCSEGRAQHYRRPEGAPRIVMGPSFVQGPWKERRDAPVSNPNEAPREETPAEEPQSVPTAPDVERASGDTDELIPESWDGDALAAAAAANDEAIAEDLESHLDRFGDRLSDLIEEGKSLIAAARAKGDTAALREELERVTAERDKLVAEERGKTTGVRVHTAMLEAKIEALEADIEDERAARETAEQSAVSECARADRAEAALAELRAKVDRQRAAALAALEAA